MSRHLRAKVATSPQTAKGDALMSGSYRGPTTKLMVSAAFGGDLDPDVDSAAAELRQAGYEVHRPPAQYRGCFYHPQDDHIEAVIPGPNDDRIIHAVMTEVDRIVHRYGGCVIEFGPIPDDYEPFADLFSDVLAVPGRADRGSGCDVV
jgi:hypothetical protein